MPTPAPNANSLRAARAAARDICALNGVEPGERTEALQLVVSELVGNAVRHGRQPVAYDVSASGADLMVTVDDADPSAPIVPDTLPEDAEGGRGLFLVQAVSRAWGWHRRAGGKRVWAKL